MNDNNQITSNFSDGLWDINNSTVTLTTNNPNEITNGITDQNLDFTNGTTTISQNDTNSSANLVFNISRQNNTTQNPFIFLNTDITAINVSYDFMGQTISGSASSVDDGNITFVYGRANAQRHRFTKADRYNVPIYYEIFCNGCDKTLLPNGINSRSTNHPRWFINTQHTNAMGSATNVTQKGTSRVTEDTPPTGNHQDLVVLTYDGSRSYPYKATMQINPSSWLIYNKYNSAATTNEFEIEFTQDTSNKDNWAGVAEDGAGNSKSSAASKTNRRTMW
jgi:hypothetical protein